MRDPRPTPTQSSMPNSPPAATAPQDSEEALQIADTSMVFRSKRTSAPTMQDKKASIKATRGKLISRKSTPAPTFKRNGRKRLDDSPLPEDKQVWKRIDFGDIPIDFPDAPKCKGELFPALTRHGSENLQQGRGEEAPLEESHRNWALVCFNPTSAGGAPSEAGGDAGKKEAAGSNFDHLLCHNRSTANLSSNSKLMVGGEIVKFPHLEQETKVLFESKMESSLVEVAHGDKVLRAVGDHTMPKNASLALVAQLDSADILDLAAAQPLLAGPQPEKTQTNDGNGAVASLNMEPLLVSYGEPPACPDGGHVEMAAQGGCGLEVVDGGLGVGGPALVSPVSGVGYVAPLDEFPPLDRGQFLKIRNRFEPGSMHSVEGSRGAGRGADQQPPPEKSAQVLGTLVESSARMPELAAMSAVGHVGSAEPSQRHAGTPAGACAGTQGGPGVEDVRGQKGSRIGGDADHRVHASGQRTMADLLRDRPNPNSHQGFVPEKITNMGFASTSNGLPSIYFSGAEIQRLADNMGYAIVGKFSHSIPNSKQIEKSFENIKFQRGFSWRYINAKHILVQFDDLADYARLLSGPKGTPVWYIDRHPMRVFKWTPDFDVFCESPIAAIWCNLIGLPIHLFDQSALFAIGKLLGTPIQVDRATADRSRLSFARICIEIDITKPPPTEIILDICGREIVQQVRWGKIPDFCQECKHVGHSSEMCYAAGKMERPERKNYHAATPKQNHQGGQAEKGFQDRPTQPQKEKEKGRQGQDKGKGSAKGDGSAGVGGSTPMAHMEMDNPSTGWAGPDILGGSCGSDRGKNLERVGRGEGEESEGVGDGMELDRGFEFYEVGLPNHVRSRSYGGRGSIFGGRGCARGSGRSSADGGRGAVGGRGFAGGRGPADSVNFLSSNQFYSLMGNGEYDVDGSGEDDPTRLDES